MNVLETKTAEAESRTMETELQVKPLRCARTQNRSDAFFCAALFGPLPAWGFPTAERGTPQHRMLEKQLALLHDLSLQIIGSFRLPLGPTPGHAMR